MSSFNPDHPPGPYMLHCRFGSFPLSEPDLNNVIANGKWYAERHGVCVLITDAHDNDLVFIAPAPQCEDIPAILFDGLAPRPGVVASN